MKADKELIEYIKTRQKTFRAMADKYQPNTPESNKHIWGKAKDDACQEILDALGVEPDTQISHEDSPKSDSNG